MDQQQLQAFVTLANYENMSTTAQIMNTTQPQISRIISSLEAEVGVQLFTRAGRGIQLNEHGSVFLQYANDILEGMASGRTAMRNLQNSYVGRITICTFAFSPILYPFMKTYLAKYPHTSFSFRASSSKFDMKRVDCILAPRLHGHYVFESHYPVFQKILSEDYYFVAAQSYLPASLQKPSLSIRDLLTYPFILMSRHSQNTNNNDYSLMEDICSQAGVASPTTCLEVNEFSFKAFLVREGMGISFLPESCLQIARSIAPHMQVYKIEGYTPSRTVLLARKANEHASSVTLDFWKHVQNSL